MNRSVGAGLIVALIGAAVSFGGAKAQAASEDPDWPCVQRLVPALSAATVWDGPDIAAALDIWQERSDVRSMVLAIAPRRTAIDKAEASIAEFAQGLGEEKDAVMTQVFAGLFQATDQDRGELIAGIKRYAKRQRRLAAKLRESTAQLNRLPKDGMFETTARRERLTERLTWDTRIYDEREKSLRALCEQPVLLEQRLFRLTRAIRTTMNQ